MEIFALMAAVLIIGLWAAFTYNSLVFKKNQANNAFSGIDTMLKKRYDLIPNVVETVKGYMKHEKDVLTRITEIRAGALSGPHTENEIAASDSKMTKLIKSLLFSFENYPDLKASENFLKLQGTLNEVEEQLSASRRTYNACIKEYNDKVHMFPSNLIAGIFRFKERPFFEAGAEERNNINVSIGN